MGAELRPCVFCGCDEARAVVVDEVTDAGYEEATVPLYAASCPYCGARGPMALSEDEAVEAWNRRAERTCRMVDNGCELCCSECDARHEYDDEPNYCDNCGARVVTGDDA